MALYLSEELKESMFPVFCKMSEYELAHELVAVKDALNVYLDDEAGIHGSFICGLLDEIYLFERDILELRFIYSHFSADLAESLEDDSSDGCSSCE